MADLFKTRRLLIATKHGKEAVLAPLLEHNLGVTCFTTQLFDTDLLGTFTGEVERKGNAIETLREKCRLAMQVNNCDLVVASEGSFGPHPTVFFANGDEELLMLMDAKHGLEIVASELSLNTNFNGKKIQSKVELLNFAESIGFPEHGIILKTDQYNPDNCIKGILSVTELLAAYRQISAARHAVWAETDMRACYNPTRMSVIGKAAKKLLAAIQSHCPQCAAPGFVVKKVVRGLPCGQCRFPTSSVMSHILQCEGCGYHETQQFPNKKITEDATYCDYCNP